MKAFSVEEPFKLRDCIPDEQEKKILEGKMDPKDLQASAANYHIADTDTLVDKLGEKINEIESLLRIYFEEKWKLPNGSLDGPFITDNGSSVDKGKKELPHAFKWTLTRDFEMRLFEVYFLGEAELKIKRDVATFSAVSAYPPPPKPKVIGYTPV